MIGGRNKRATAWASVGLAATVALLSAASCTPKFSKPERLYSADVEPGHKLTTPQGIDVEVVSTGHEKPFDGPEEGTFALHLRYRDLEKNVDPLPRHQEGSLGDLVFQVTQSTVNGPHHVNLYRQGRALLPEDQAVEIGQKAADHAGCAKAALAGLSSDEASGTVEPMVGGGCKISVGLYTGDAVVLRGPGAR